MAKKKHKKKHNFKYSAPSASSNTTPGGELRDAAKVTTTTQSSVSAVSPGLAYVRQDLKKVVALASSFIVLQIVLSYLFLHTGLGPKVYGLIKL